jgi:outer membrane receptor protein involved in Fe transport
MPFKGRSNFTDISSIPLGMVERIEVLTGSGSAVYGSDAISGVINFILKKQADGTTVDLRYGDTTRGGGQSMQLSLSSGFSRGGFNAMYGVELLDQKPLWAYDRDVQDSVKDSPASNAASRRAFLRTAWDPDDGDNEYYVDPGQATCDALGYLNGGSTYYASRARWGRYDPVADEYPPGYFCGSDEAIGYGTIISKRQGANAYASLSYAFGDNKEWFADVQLGYHKVELFTDVRSWNYMAPDGNEEGYFFNQASGQVEYWQRQFSPEEMGGLDQGMIRNTQKTFSIATGFKGVFGENWDWEAAFSHSQYQSEIGWPQIVAAKANDLFLGPQLGVDDASGLPIFNADPNRLYTPLTKAEYDSIAAYTIYHPRSRTDTLSFSVANTDLFQMPAGPAGFAGVVEVGNQSYNLNPDPLALQYYYYSWKDSDGAGSRDRWAAAGELRMPLLDTLDLSTAARYDQYRYSGTEIGKFTYSAGLEWRPFDSLLVRGSYGTAFRAADLHYLYAGIGNDETSGVDYYRCRSEEPGVELEDCSWSDEGLIRTRSGNRGLGPETSTSWTTGLVWSPSANFDVSLDYFDIDMRNQVQDMRNDAVLQDEANCRLGERMDGTPVDINSPTCVDAISRVTRIDGRLYGIYVNPINIARESTSGVDLNTHYLLETGIGDFRFTGNYTWVRAHDFQQFDGDAIEDEFEVNSGFDIPRTKASATVSWERNAWTAALHGERLGKLPSSDSYDQVFDPEDEEGLAWIGATYRYNATLQYRVTDHARLSFAVNNLFDKMPPRDPTYTAYPYYDISWFDTMGRTFYLEFTYKFGGTPLYATSATDRKNPPSGGFFFVPADGSDVEAEVQNVAFLDPVFLALQPQPAGIAGAGLAAVLDEVIKADGLGADEALLEVGMDDGRGLRRGRAALHGPGADFLDPGGEVGLQAQQLVGGADDAVQARLVQAQVGEEGVAVLVLELAQFLLDGGRDRHHLGALAQRPRTHGVQVRVVAEAVLEHVGDVHHRLERQQEQVADRGAVLVGQPQRARRLAGVQPGAHPRQHLDPRPGVLVAGLGGALGALQRLVDRFQVRQRQLGVDRLDVGDRVDPVADVDHVVVLEAAHHVGDRVDFADVREELVAQALAAGGAGDQAGDVDELDRGRDHLLRLDDFGQRVEPGVRHRHHADVRLDRAEGEVGRGDAGLGQRVEQGRLADVRQADDAALDAHRCTTPCARRGRRRGDASIRAACAAASWLR